MLLCEDNEQFINSRLEVIRRRSVDGAIKTRPVSPASRCVDHSRRHLVRTATFGGISNGERDKYSVEYVEKSPKYLRKEYEHEHEIEPKQISGTNSKKVRRHSAVSEDKRRKGKRAPASSATRRADKTKQSSEDKGKSTPVSSPSRRADKTKQSSENKGKRRSSSATRRIDKPKHSEEKGKRTPVSPISSMKGKRTPGSSATTRAEKAKQSEEKGKRMPGSSATTRAEKAKQSEEKGKRMPGSSATRRAEKAKQSEEKGKRMPGSSATTRAEKAKQSEEKPKVSPISRRADKSLLGESDQSDSKSSGKLRKKCPTETPKHKQRADKLNPKGLSVSVECESYEAAATADSNAAIIGEQPWQSFANTPDKAIAGGKRPGSSSVSRRLDHSPILVPRNSSGSTGSAGSSGSGGSRSPRLPRVASVKLSPKNKTALARKYGQTRPYDFRSPPDTQGVIDRGRRGGLGRFQKSRRAELSDPTSSVSDTVRRSRLLQPKYRCRSSRTVRKRLRNPMALASAGAPRWLTKLAISKNFSGQPTDNSPEKPVLNKALPLKAGERVLERPSTFEPPSLRMFEVVGCLGKGAFGKVMLVTKRPKKRDGPRTHSVFGRDARARKKFAMKVVCKAKMARKGMCADVAAERKILQHRNKYLVRLRYAFQTDKHIFLVLNYVAGGSLNFHLKRKKLFPEHWVQLYAAELFAAIECLHSRNILHRDIKPENIMIRADGHVQLTDFGFSIFTPDMLVSGSDRVGSPVYMSPEMISGKSYGMSVDWWAYGIVVYQMSQGTPPFTGSNLKDCFTAILRAKVEFVADCSETFQNFAKQILDPKLSTRLGCGPKGPAEIQQHAFLAKGNWTWAQLRDRKVHAPFLPGEVTIVKTDDVEIGSLDDSNWASSLTHKHKKQLLSFSQNFRDYSYERGKQRQRSNSSPRGGPLTTAPSRRRIHSSPSSDASPTEPSEMSLTDPSSPAPDEPVAGAGAGASASAGAGGASASAGAGASASAGAGASAGAIEPRSSYLEVERTRSGPSLIQEE